MSSRIQTRSQARNDPAASVLPWHGASTLLQRNLRKNAVRMIEYVKNYSHCLNFLLCSEKKTKQTLGLVR